MRKVLYIFIWCLLTGMIISCGEDQKESRIETPEIVFEKEAELFLIKNEDTIQQLDLEIAETAYERETGLMYRESMEANQGMLFIFPNEGPRSFYMKNTYIPLDLIFYRQDSTALSIYENAQPMDETSIPSNGPAKFVLEVNAGKAQEWGMEPGDRMSLNILD